MYHHWAETAPFQAPEGVWSWGMCNDLKVSLQTTIYNLADSGWSQR